MRILLVEPDRLTAKEVASYLSQQHTVLHAVDAQAAIHTFDNQNIDAVVLELVLPGHNGIEFLYELRSYDDLQYVPVVVYTQTKTDQAEHQQLTGQLGVRVICYKGSTSLAQLSECLLELQAAHQ